MLTHKNERPHVCPQCSKDFTRQHDWKRHMELHDPSKKFKCAGHLADGRHWGCNKEFARKDALSRHFKSQQVHLTLELFVDVRDDNVLMKFSVKDGHWRIYMNNRDSLLDNSARIPPRECMMIKLILRLLLVIFLLYEYFYDRKGVVLLRVILSRSVRFLSFLEFMGGLRFTVLVAPAGWICRTLYYIQRNQSSTHVSLRITNPSICVRLIEPMSYIYWTILSTLDRMVHIFIWSL
jgi:Zinc finger, C2H2 type